MLDNQVINELKKNNQLDELLTYLLSDGNLDDAYCQFCIGEVYEKKQDYEKAVYYYELAAKQNYVGAFAMLGYLYGAKKDFSKAFECYQRGEELEDLTCRLNLGICYYYGLGVTRDYSKAHHLFSQLPNVALANRFLGDIYFNGLGVNKDFLLAYQYYEMAAKQNDAYSMGKMACHYYDNRDFKEAFYWAEKGSKLNEKDCIFILGQLYDAGFDGDENKYIKALYQKLEPLYDQSFEIYKKGEDLNCEKSKLYVAIAYFHGLGVNVNFTEAITRFRQLTQYTAANYYLGVAYYKGYGVDKNNELAKQYLTVAGNSGNGEARGYLAEIYYYDEKNDALAFEWAMKGSQLNNMLSWHILGKIYRSRKDYDNAYLCFLQSDTREDSQIELGFAYRNGHGTPKDDYRAFAYFEKNKHHVLAQAMLGELYYLGEGCIRSYPLAFHYYEQAALNGHVTAMGNLAHLYYGGFGVEKNDERVFYWATKAAKLNNASGYHYLGALYAQGLYVQKDDYKAVSYFHKAAELGDAKAQYWLAMAYRDGKGTSKNTFLYYEWLKKSADQGDEAAIEELNDYYHRGFYY